jgi:Family of unknown function (DUF6331)
MAPCLGQTVGSAALIFRSRGRTGAATEFWMAVRVALPPRLSGLVRSCETNCVAACCGIDAFDFSPLNCASFISSGSGAISAEELETWHGELDRLAQQAAGSELQNDGVGPVGDAALCWIDALCHEFTRDTFAAWIAELRHNIAMAPQVLALSEALRRSKNETL